VSTENAEEPIFRDDMRMLFMPTRVNLNQRGVVPISKARRWRR
jgi:hypothetical protein